MAVITKMHEDQTLPLSLLIKDDQGHAAKVDGVPVWDLTQGAETGVTLVAETNGMTATLTAPAGSAGTARVIVSADADLGEGVRSITSECDIIITPRDAVSVEIVPGTPSDTPSAPTPAPQAVKAHGHTKKGKP